MWEDRDQWEKQAEEAEPEEISSRRYNPVSAIRAAEYIGDFEIALGVKNVLEDAEEIDASHIIVDVRRGVITLEGTVPDHFQRVTAIDLVSEAYQSKQVKNELHLA